MKGVIATKSEDQPREDVFPGIRKRQLFGRPGERQDLLLELQPGARWPELDEHLDGRTSMSTSTVPRMPSF